MSNGIHHQENANEMNNEISEQLDCTTSRTPTILNAGEDVDQQELSFIDGGNE